MVKYKVIFLATEGFQKEKQHVRCCKAFMAIVSTCCLFIKISDSYLTGVKFESDLPERSYFDSNIQTIICIV